MVALSALLVLHSCARMEASSDAVPSEIVMRSPVTKADYPVDGIFGVYAYHIPAPGGSTRLDYWNADDVTPYLQNVAFKHDGTEASGWKDGAHYPYYWPLSGSMVFTCYSPYISESGGSITDVSYRDNLTTGRKENPNLAVSFVQKTTPAEMVDLLYFSTMQQSVDKTQGNVPVTFSRALSKLSFYFSDPKGYYRINNIRLCNCINKGIFFAAVESPGWYPDLDQLSDYDLVTSAQQLDSAADNFGVHSLYVIPQPMDGEYSTLQDETGMDVILCFDLLAKDDDNFSYAMELNLNNPENANIPADWVRGVSYEYYLSIEADLIEFDAPTVSVMVVDTPETI